MVYSDGTNQTHQKIPRSVKTLLGGFCGMIATTVVHPLDLVKVRMQVYPSTRTTIEMGRCIIRCEGYSALYVGITAGLLRQATHTTTRLGVYYWLYEEYRNKYGISPSFSDKMTIGAYAGLLGAFAGNPSEVALIRMMADGKRDPCSNEQAVRRYHGAFNAIYKIYSTEGFCALWRGGTLTLTRSLFVSLAQIGTYTQVHAYLKDSNLAKRHPLRLYTAIVSSFFTAILTLPVDLVKTRYQYQRDGHEMTQPQVVEYILKNKGFLYFWKGFFPYYTRLSIHTALTYYLLEESNHLYVHYRMQPTS